jgi:DNA-binding transcriptional regulator GbsR (MarR family)
MTELSIGTLLQDFKRNQEKWKLETLQNAMYRAENAKLQSALTTAQEQLNDEIKAHEQIANTCQKAGGRDIDGTSTGYVESLVELLTTVQEENKQYKNALETIRKYSVKHAIWEIVTMCESALNGGKNE